MHSALKVQNTFYCETNNKEDNRAVIFWMHQYPEYSITAASHLWNVSTDFAHQEIFAHSLQNTSGSDRVDVDCEQEFSNLATDFQLDSGLGYDWAI